MTAAQRERAALVETMRAVGPDAPTLCGDWTTRDLAAHLVVREGRLDAAPGIAIPFLAGYTDKVQRQVAQSSDWDDLLDKIAIRPAAAVTVQALRCRCRTWARCSSTTRMSVAPNPLGNQGHSTTTPPRALTRPLSVMARLTLRAAPARVSLRTPEGKTVLTTGKGKDLTVTGDETELLLFISGRDVVRLTFDGDADTVEAVRAARRPL